MILKNHGDLPNRQIKNLVNNTASSIILAIQYSGYATDDRQNQTIVNI